MTPTRLSLDKLRAEGWRCEVVEVRRAKTRRTHDLFGFGDIEAFHPLKKRTLIVQATDGTNVSHRVQKVKALDMLRDWLLAGNEFEVWGWREDETLRRVRFSCDGGSITWEEG